MNSTRVLNASWNSVLNQVLGKAEHCEVSGCILKLVPSLTETRVGRLESDESYRSGGEPQKFRVLSEYTRFLRKLRVKYQESDESCCWKPKVHGRDWLFRLHTMTAILDFALCSPFFSLLLSPLVPTINSFIHFSRL
jgi:hypothetical protein